MKIRTWKEIIKMLKKNEENTEMVFIEDKTKKDIIPIRFSLMGLGLKVLY